MFGITPKNQYRPAISMPTSKKATPAITEILDSCRAVLERLRADSMSPLAMALRDWKWYKQSSGGTSGIAIY